LVLINVFPFWPCNFNSTVCGRGFKYNVFHPVNCKIHFYIQEALEEDRRTISSLIV